MTSTDANRNNDHNSFDICNWKQRMAERMFQNSMWSFAIVGPRGSEGLVPSFRKLAIIGRMRKRAMAVILPCV